MTKTIEATIPNRLSYFDSQDFDLFPVVIPENPLRLTAFTFDSNNNAIYLNWSSSLGSNYYVGFSTDLHDWELLQSKIASQGGTTSFSCSTN